MTSVSSGYSGNLDVTRSDRGGPRNTSVQKRVHHFKITLYPFRNKGDECDVNRGLLFNALRAKRGLAIVGDYFFHVYVYSVAAISSDEINAIFEDFLHDNNPNVDRRR
jgi:hypothetical protein